MNEIDKGSTRRCYIPNIKALSRQVSGIRILKLVFFVPMFQLVTPVVGPVLTPGHDMNKVDKGSYGDAYYQISKL